MEKFPPGTPIPSAPARLLDSREYSNSGHNEDKDKDEDDNDVYDDIKSLVWKNGLFIRVYGEMGWKLRMEMGWKLVPPNHHDRFNRLLKYRVCQRTNQRGDDVMIDQLNKVVIIPQFSSCVTGCFTSMWCTNGGVNNPLQ